MADDVYDRILAVGGKQAAAPSGSVYDGILGVKPEKETYYGPWQQALDSPDTAAMAKIARTALVGAEPGAVTAREQVVNPDKSEFTKTLEATYRSFVPKFAQDPRLGKTGPGIAPTLEQIQKAAKTDPQVGRIYYEEWLRGRNAKATIADPVRQAFQGDAQGPSASTFLPPKPPPSAEQVASNDDLAARVFSRLSQEQAQSEQKFSKEHPWLTATAEIPGEAARMIPAAAGAALTGGAGLIPSALTFDLILQAQKIRAGGQKEWSPEQSAVNLISMFTGAAAGSVAAKAGGSKAAQILASNLGMFGAPSAIEAAKGVSEKGKVDWGELARQLYKGVSEAGILSSAHLSAAHAPADVVPERNLAREMVAQEQSGDRTMIDTVAALEKAVKEGKPPGEPTPAPIPGAPESQATAIKAAQDAVLRGGMPEADRTASRQRREALLRRGMLPGADAEFTSFFDAAMSLKADIVNEPPGSARRLYFGSDEYAGKIADQFGVTDEANRQMLRELGSDLILEPHAKAEKQGGFAKIGQTEEERAQANEQARRITQEHQRVIAEVPERLREMTNDMFERLVKATGHESKGKPFISRTDPGIERAFAREGVPVANMRRELKGVERQFQELIRATPHPETMNRILTLGSMVGPEEGASVALKTLPTELREPVSKYLFDYANIARKYGKAGVEAGTLPEARWAVPYYDETGAPKIREVVTKPGEPAPEGGNVAGLAKPWLIGGRQAYEGKYVHQSYERGKQGEGFQPKRESTALSYISQATPSSSFRRTKSAQEFVEQGIVKMEPTFRQLAKQGENIQRFKVLKYLENERHDLYLKKSDFEGNVEQTYLKQIEQSKTRIKEVERLVKAQEKEMAQKGLGIYAGESGELTKAMAASRARISRDFHAQSKMMSERLIPVNGMPEDFDPTAPGSKRRAREIRREQARYDQLAKQLWTHLQVERDPNEMFGVKQVMREGEVEANLKLRQLHDELIALRNIASSTWVPLQNTKQVNYGEHAGDYIRSDALRDISFGNEHLQNTMTLFDALNGLFKWSRVPGNPVRSFTTQMLGNVWLASFGGVQFTMNGIGHWIESARQVLPYLWSEGKAAPSDPLFHELLDTARTSGPLAMYDAPTAAKERIYAAFDAAKEAWQNHDPVNAARLMVVGLLRAGPYIAGKIPIFGKATRLTTAMDLIPQYAMYRQLRTGDGSTLGALEMEEALTHTGYFYDMSDIPKWIEKATRHNVLKWVAPTFARFAYKAPTALLKWMMASPPTVGTYFLPGLKLPQVFEEAILDHAGTSTATKLLWANKATNLALNAVKLATHFAVSSWIATKRLGIDPDSEEYKRRLLAEAGGSPTRALFMRPYAIDNDGNIKFWDFFNLFPGTNVLSLGSMPETMSGKGPVSRALQYALSLNWMSNLAQHLVNQTDYQGRDISVTKSLVDAAANFLPGGFEMPARAIYQSQQIGSQKSLGESLFQALSGINIKVGQPGEESRLDLQDLEEGGHIKAVKQWMPTDDEGKLGLKLYNAEPRNRMNAILRKIERIDEKK